MQVHHKPTKILILGMSGQGKTTYMIRFVEHAPYKRIFVFDHKLEFLERCGYEPCYDMASCAESLKRGDRIISYHSSEEFPGMAEEAFQEYAQWVYEVCKIINDEKGNALFVCDEVNRFTDTGDLGDGFKVLIEDGRLQGLDFIGTSHAANQISNRLRLQLSEIVTFQTHDKRPLNFLDESGFDCDAVEALTLGEYICKDMETNSFYTGRLFSVDKKRVETLDEEKGSTATQLQTEEPQHALSPSPTDSTTVHRHSGADEPD